MNDVFALFAVTLFAGLIYAGLQPIYSRREWPLIQASLVAHYLTGYANLAVVYWIYGRGDMLMFHRIGVELSAAVRADFTSVFPQLVLLFLHQPVQLSVGLHGSDTTGTMQALAAFGCMLMGDSLWGISLLYTMVSFLGKVAMYHAVRGFFSDAHRWYVGVGVLLIPSVVYWTSGLIKESVVVAGMGFAALGLHLAVRRQFVGLLPLIAGFGIVALVKPHVLITFSVAAGVYLYWNRSVQRGQVEIRPFSLVAGFVVAVGGVLAVGEVFPRFALDNLIEETAMLQVKAEKGGSSFSLGGGEASLARQLVIAPLALLTCFYRPLIFEATNAQMAANALETTAFLGLTARMALRLRFKDLVALLVQYPFLVFCIVFSVVTGVGVGLATGNLGTLSRYRVPMMPFLSIFLVVCNLGVARKRAVAKAPTAPIGGFGAARAVR